MAPPAPPFAIDSTPLCDSRRRPHDLLRLRRLPAFEGEPPWVRDAFARAPFAVVRRAPAAGGFVAIGIRGCDRSQRYGTWAETGDIEAAVAPEELTTAVPAADRLALPAFAALAALATLHRESACLNACAWGPAGSAGFELAARVAAVTLSSDLDLLIRTPEKLPHDTAVRIANELRAHAQRAGIRIDAQLETPAGGVALAELAAGKARVLARHAQGPTLVADPWACAPGTA